MIGNLWKRFWNWYSDNIEKSILVTLVIMVLQIPHFVWAGDAYLQLGIIAHVHPVLDFFLYGIDLVEVPLILKTITDFIVLYRKKHDKKEL